MMRAYVVGVTASLGLVAAATVGQHLMTQAPDGHGSGGHRLSVTTKISPGRHGELFTEGAVPEIRLVSRSGTSISPVRDHVASPVFKHLEAGRYVLKAVLRPCDGSCDYLDAPVSPCRTVVHVPADRTARVTWRVGEDCHAR
jgi:hypothetical protein